MTAFQIKITDFDFECINLSYSKIEYMTRIVIYLFPGEVITQLVN